MDIRNVYKLGSMTEIKSIKSPTNATVLIYTKGEHLVNKLLKKGNCTLPKKEIYKIAGVIETTDLDQVCACCFAKGLYDKVKEVRDRTGAPVQISKVLNEYMSDLNRASGMRLMHSITSGTTEDLQKDYIALSAKKFLRLPTEKQERTMTTLTQSFNCHGIEM